MSEVAFESLTSNRPLNLKAFALRRRKAAAACFGLTERSDQLWAFNKATSATGGLAALLTSEFPGLREDAAAVLDALVLPWPSPNFWACLGRAVTQLNKVWLDPPR